MNTAKQLFFRHKNLAKTDFLQELILILEGDISPPGLN